MKKQVVKNKNALGLKLWFKLLGYKIKDLAGQGFTARLEDRALIKQLVQDCQAAFTKERLAIALSDDVQALIQERDALKAKLKAKVA